MRKPFTTTEIKLLCTETSTTIADMAAAMQHPVSSVKTTLSALQRAGRAPYKQKPYSTDDDKMIADLYGTMPTARLAAQLGRHPENLTRHASRLRSKGVMMAQPCPVWSPDDDKALTMAVGSGASWSAIGAALVRSAESCRCRAKRIGIKREAKQ